MGVPTSEVGYTIATTRRETTRVHKNMWWHWGEREISFKPAPFPFNNHPGYGQWAHQKPQHSPDPTNKIRHLKRVKKLSKRTDGTIDNRNVQFVNFSDGNEQGRGFKQG